MPDPDLEQCIRERAFFLWIEQGRPEGCDKEHWQQAESELMAGIAAAESEPEAAEVAPEEAPSIQAAPGVVDQGGSACDQQQSQTSGQSWDAYRR
jgi:hypothetical protein